MSFDINAVSLSNVFLSYLRGIEIRLNLPTGMGKTLFLSYLRGIEIQRDKRSVILCFYRTYKGLKL